MAERGVPISNKVQQALKPKLGKVKLLDRDTNQLRPDWVKWPANVPVPELGIYMLSLVFENPIPGAPDSQRFGAYWIETQTTDDGTRRWMHKALAWSPDGIRWTRASTAHDVHRAVSAGRKPASGACSSANASFGPRAANAGAKAALKKIAVSTSEPASELNTGARHHARRRSRLKTVTSSSWADRNAAPEASAIRASRSAAVSKATSPEP